MKKDTSYHDFVVYDLMNKLPNITSRPMMSGWCIYSENIPFGAIIGNQLYLKGKREFANKLASLGWKKFEYKKTSGKTVHMNYWQVPDELIDDQETLTDITNEIILND